MKYIKYIILSGLVGLALWSCKDDPFGPILNYNGIPVLTAPVAGTNWELLESKADSLLPDFTWTGADFGFRAGAKYNVEIDAAGNNFAAPISVGIVNALSLSITQGDLNNALLTKEFEGGTPVDIDVRVVATLTSEVTPLISDPVTITVTPYAATIVVPHLYVPGSYQGWDPSNESTVVYSPTNNGLYEGYLYIGDDNAKYKFTLLPNWDTNWGDDGNDGTLDPGGTDIPAGLAGVYKLNADINALTHTALRTEWGLIGSATADGWNSDQNLTYDPATKKFTITVDLAVGEVKFRANDDWAFNFGDEGNNKTLEYNGANIAITEAGNYTLTLSIVGVSKYKYAIKKN